MSMRYQAGIMTASYFPLKVPNRPTGATATMVSGTSVSVAFTAPTDVGAGAITGYTVVSSGGQIATGASSPVTVTGLTTGVAYTFVVYANNAFGNSPPSAPSNSVTPVTQGQQEFTTAGTFSWVAPADVTSVSVVAVGGGGAAGGGLGWKNNIPVTPGNSYTVVVGAGRPASNSSGGDSSFINTSTVAGFGGGTSTGGGYVGDGGGNGGNQGSAGFAGGGAGGYTGSGGSGAPFGNSAGSSGSGGGGGGGGHVVLSGSNNAGGGGGVGLLGQGANGAGGTASSGNTGGGGGSGGNNGGSNSGTSFPGAGGARGGGGAYSQSGNYAVGASGAVRIIWPGTSRSFPSTNTGNV